MLDRYRAVGGWVGGSPHGTQRCLPHLGVAHVVVQQQRVHLAVHVLDGYLEAVEGPRLWRLHVCTTTGRMPRERSHRSGPSVSKHGSNAGGARGLPLTSHEALRQVLHDDAVTGREEGQHVLDEVALVVCTGTAWESAS